MVLYKYRAIRDSGIDRSYIRQILVDHELYFSTRPQLNDPFECIVPFFYSAPLSFWRDEVKRLMGEVPVRKLRREMERQLRSRSSREEMQRDIQADIDKIGMLCLSERTDDILMWSHYAAGHQGICLGFQVDENDGFFCHGLPVDYPDSDERPKWDHRDTKLEHITKILLTKAKHWRYEREWRIVKPPPLGGAGPHKFPIANLTAVIFGCRLKMADRRQIAD